jgi:hypothetical protein
MATLVRKWLVGFTITWLISICILLGILIRYSTTIKFPPKYCTKEIMIVVPPTYNFKLSESLFYKPKCNNKISSQNFTSVPWNQNYSRSEPTSGIYQLPISFSKKSEPYHTMYFNNTSPSSLIFIEILRTPFDVKMNRGMIIFLIILGCVFTVSFIGGLTMQGIESCSKNRRIRSTTNSRIIPDRGIRPTTGYQTPFLEQTASV